MNSIQHILKWNCLWVLAGLTTLSFSCTQKQSQPVIKVERDTTITVANAFTNLFLDSSLVAKHIEEGQLDDSLAVLLQNFYNSRNYQMAWFTEDGAAEQTQAF